MLIYPLIKASAPTALVGVANAVTYLSFYAYTNTQISNRNLKIKNQFTKVKKSVFDQLFTEKDDLMSKRYGEIFKYFNNSENQKNLTELGWSSLVSKWKEVAPTQGENNLRDDGKKVNFFQEVRYFCASQQNTEVKEVIIIVSKLCSKQIVTENDFILPEERDVR